MAAKSKKIPSLIPRRADPQITPATPTSLGIDNQPIGLNTNLLPLNSPITANRGFVTSLNFDSNYEKNAVGAYSIKKIPWIDATDAAPVVIDLSKGNRQRVTITANRT